LVPSQDKRDAGKNRWKLIKEPTRPGSIDYVLFDTFGTFLALLGAAGFLARPSTPADLGAGPAGLLTPPTPAGRPRSTGSFLTGPAPPRPPRMLGDGLQYNIVELCS